MKTEHVSEGAWVSHIEGPGSGWVDSSYLLHSYDQEDHAGLLAFLLKMRPMVQERLDGANQRYEELNAQHHQLMVEYAAQSWWKRLFGEAPQPFDLERQRLYIKMLTIEMGRIVSLLAQLEITKEFPHLFHYQTKDDLIQRVSNLVA